MPTAPIIQTKKLNKYFPIGDQTTHVLKDIDMSINSGEFVIIFGPSGSGKSTLLYTILGLEDPTSGDVYFENQHLNTLSDDQITLLRKKKIGMVYQQTNWIKSLTVIENVAFPLLLTGKDQLEALNDAFKQLQKVGMQNWAHYQPNELSSGQQQKVSLARALITNPEIIIADEPTGNLDFTSGEELMDLIKDLNEKEGKTIILVTHDLSYLRYAQRILQIFDGKIIHDLNIKEMNEQQVVDEVTKNAQPSTKENTITRNPVFKSIKSQKIKKTYVQKLRQIPHNLKQALAKVLLITEMGVLITLFLINRLIREITFRLKINPKFLSPLKFIGKGWNKLYRYLAEKNIKEESIKKIDIIYLAIKNLSAKKSRSIVTIGGMSIGIGFIVLLISIGYGVEQLVLDRIATLQSRQQIEIRPAVNSNLNLNNQTLQDFATIENVQSITPLVSFAGKATYNNSELDIIINATPSNYISTSDIEILEGKIYESNNDISLKTTPENLLKENESKEDDILEGFAKKQITGPFVQEILINTQTKKVLGIEDPLKKKLDVSYIINSGLLELEHGIQSQQITYEIVGVLEDGEDPLVYIPLQNLENAGIQKYSSTRLTAQSENSVKSIRQKIEAQGFTTTSVLDTIEEVESTFNAFRLLLFSIGMAALIISSLGMFNTLTISLLERTREIGFMRTVGMLSDEIFELTLAESLSIAFLGGAFGLGIGFASGEILSLLLSLISVLNGGGYIDISSIPLSLIGMVLLLSLFIGILTGLYPARRSTKISPLDALRYE